MKKIISFALLILAPILLSKCVTYKKCEEKFSHGTRIDTVHVHDTIHYTKIVSVPADTSTLYATWQNLWKLTIKDTIKSFSQDGKIEIDQFKKNGSDTIETNAKYKGDTIVIHDTIVINKDVVCPPCKQFADIDSAEKKHPGITAWIMKGIRHMKFVVAGILFAIIFLSIILKRIFK